MNEAIIASSVGKNLQIWNMCGMIEIVNVGPIAKLSFETPQEGGVVVLCGPNGCGKTTALEAIRSVVRGTGTIPLREGAKSGYIQVGNAKATAAKKPKFSGHWLEEHREDGESIASFVEPGLKSADAADRARLKVLASLIGADPTYEIFEEVFPNHISDLEDVWEQPNILAACNLAKRQLEAKAREYERLGGTVVDPLLVDKLRKQLYSAARNLVVALDEHSNVDGLEDELCGIGMELLDAKRCDSSGMAMLKGEMYRDLVKELDKLLIRSITTNIVFFDEGRIYAVHPDRGPLPFAEFSDGEKWKIAVDILVEDMNGGLIVLDQTAWEGLDGLNRNAIHQYALKKGIVIITGESSKNTKREDIFVVTL